MKTCGYQWNRRDEGPGGCFRHTCVGSLVHVPPHRCQCGSEDHVPDIFDPARFCCEGYRLGHQYHSEGCPHR